MVTTVQLAITPYVVSDVHDDVQVRSIRSFDNLHVGVGDGFDFGANGVFLAIEEGTLAHHFDDTLFPIEYKNFNLFGDKLLCAESVQKLVQDSKKALTECQ